MKQIIRNISTCRDCPFVEWNYNEFGNIVWDCTHFSFEFEEEKIINDPSTIPSWCPLPDRIE